MTQTSMPTAAPGAVPCVIPGAGSRTVHGSVSHYVRRLFVALAILSAAAVGLAQNGDLDQQVFEIAHQLRCPVCVSESVADSSSRVAVEMRELIQQRIEQGESERQILAFFRERYGDWILLEPPREGIHLLVWLLPVVVVLVGAGGLGLFVRRWLAAGKDTPAVGSEDLARVRAALQNAEQGRTEDGGPAS